MAGRYAGDMPTGSTRGIPVRNIRCESAAAAVDAGRMSGRRESGEVLRESVIVGTCGVPPGVAVDSAEPGRNVSGRLCVRDQAGERRQRPDVEEAGFAELVRRQQQVGVVRDFEHAAQEVRVVFMA